ncbi:MAG: hypothetical protein HQL56_07130 [Magnetococcales bacterium]|nr:hypothetical protein [Magnetococcales bacterium]
MIWIPNQTYSDIDRFHLMLLICYLIVFIILDKIPNIELANNYLLLLNSIYGSYISDWRHTSEELVNNIDIIIPFTHIVAIGNCCLTIPDYKKIITNQYPKGNKFELSKVVGLFMVMSMWIGAYYFILFGEVGSERMVNKYTYILVRQVVVIMFPVVICFFGGSIVRIVYLELLR